MTRCGTASGPLSSQPSWTLDERIIFVQSDGEAWPGWHMATIEADGMDLGSAFASGWQLGTHPRMRPTG